MKKNHGLLFFVATVAGLSAPLSQTATDVVPYGPEAALRFAQHYRGELCEPGALNCYPAARGIPFSDTENIIPMTGELWTPAQLSADFKRRMASLSERDRKSGIIVLLKTERCATKAMRACTVTTAALEKQSTPLVQKFLIYGVLLLPRDGDNPAGSLKIETGLDAWKNEAAGEYGFKQGPGATLVFIDPLLEAKIDTTNALALDLTEEHFIETKGHTTGLHDELHSVLEKLHGNGKTTGR